MLDIRFRGKRFDNDEWVYGYYCMEYNDDDDKFYPNIQSHYPEREGQPFEIICYEIIPETVGQFTGLQDKNGKDIYEGDILREQVNRCVWKFIVGTRNDSGNNIYAIGYWRNFNVDEDSNTIYEPTEVKGKWTYICRSMEIIGNIHEPTKEIS